MRRRLRRLAWTLAALALIAGFLAALGPERVLGRLRYAEPLPLSVACLSALVGVAAWSESQRRLHGAAGAGVAPARFGAAYAASVFAKGVLPGGRAGGPAVRAYVVGRETDLAYEQDLAATSAGTVLAALAAAVPALAGLALMSVSSERTRSLLVAVGVLASAGAAAALALRTRPRAVRRVARGAAHLLARAGRATLGRLSGRVRRAMAPAKVEARLDGAGATLALVAADRRAVAVAGGLAVVGWVALSGTLSACLVALGHPPGPAVALLLVPAASLGALVPTPGGLGGVDLALGAGLVAIAGLSPAGAAAGVVLYRLCGDAFLVVVGAVAACALALR